jgi:branched-chain amino acid transport system permease protein
MNASTRVSDAAAAAPHSGGRAAGAGPSVLRRLRIDGPQSFFTGPLFWIVAGSICLLLLVYPAIGSAFVASNLTSFMLNVPLALGLALLWGHCGVLSFGQVAFFGISGYLYGVLAINLGGGTMTMVAAAAALGGSALVALAFGYFMFYGRVSGWIVPVLTLVFTLLLETFLGQTAGYEWKIGEALLGGYNGMTNIPSLAVGNLEFNGFTFPLYYVVVGLGAGLFLALRILANSHFGHVVVAIREDPERTELLGYDIRLYQLLVFVIAAVLAGISGVLYVSWGNYITPSSVGLLAATMPVLWVAVGGKTSFTAVVLSTVLLGFISDYLAVYSGEFAFVLLGALLLFGMMFAPDGIIITLASWLRSIRRRGDRS